VISVGFECYSIGDLLLDAGTQEVTRDGTVLRVPRLSFKLLLSLARHAPNIVSTQQLEQEVWEGLVVDRGTVNKRVLLLRKSLSKDKGEDPYIAVIRGSGYRLVVPVERVDCIPNEAVKKEDAPQSWYQRNAASIRLSTFWLLGFIALFAIYGVLRPAPDVDIDPGLEQSESGELTAMPEVYSQTAIAVLPFVDLSDGRTHDYLGDGVAEEVINLLAGMDGLEVAARTSSFAFRETTATLQEIASVLKVGTILEGSIRHTSDRIRVTAQLIDARSGYHIWSQNYDRAFDEVFAVQDDIASNIARALELTLNESGLPDSRKSMTADMDAFKLYLKGRDLLNDRIQTRTKGLYEALDYFNQAIEQDPKFARAHAGVASALWLLTSYDRSLDRAVWYERAEASAKFALEIDPDSTEALGALAAVYSKRGALDQAASLFDRIRSIDGSKSDVVSWEATLHIRLGYFAGMESELAREYRRDPLNEHIAWALADVLIYSGKPAQAIIILKGIQHFSYRDYYLALAAIYSGEYVVARELLKGVRMRSGIMPPAYADLVIDALEFPSQREEIGQIIVNATLAGELEKLVGFESLLMIGSPRAFDLGIDPVDDIKNLQLHAQIWNNWAVEIRRDPRFKDWVRELGYVDFWQKYGWPDRCRPTSLNDFECI